MLMKWIVHMIFQTMYVVGLNSSKNKSSENNDSDEKTLGSMIKNQIQKSILGILTYDSQSQRQWYLFFQFNDKEYSCFFNSQVNEMHASKII